MRKLEGGPRKLRSSPDNLVIVNQLVELDLLDKHFDAARQTVRRQFQKTPDAPAAFF